LQFLRNLGKNNPREKKFVQISEKKGLYTLEGHVFGLGGPPYSTVAQTKERIKL